MSRYQIELDQELDKIGIPADAATCNEPERCSPKHIMESYFDGICSSMLRCAKRCIPKAKCHGGRKFGWDEEIREARHEARKDYCRWRDAGKPRQGNLFCGMTKSRKRSKLKLN